MAPTWIPAVTAFILFTSLVLLAVVSWQLTRVLLVRTLHTFFARTTAKWDDLFVEHKLFENLAHIVPVLLFRLLTPVVFADYPEILAVTLKAVDVYIIFVIMRIITSFLTGMEAFLIASPVFKNKPIASYFQLTRILIYIAAAILVLSILLGRSPVYFLSAFGAMTAIILLIFKDTILGLVASVQISANDMVRVGDWVEMPKFNADGDVIALNLNTVKIRNWDKTITAVPTYYFITDSFKNWRGMQESGGRRIKRAIFLNQRSVKFVDPEMRERFKKYYLITEYVNRRQEEIENFNRENAIDTSTLINGRRMTNIGVFRHYTEAFLRAHKRINSEMTLIVRQLAPTDHGLPIEIYCFTNTVAFAEYEGIQSDIFDHLLAAASHFDLEIFQSPSGNDIVLAGEKLSQVLSEKNVPRQV
ncbi:mechanosensitive ion channel family protein [Adhaeribacter terreus]|uniref:Mechanosensitive ion channel family protein n=1 Tax=Adhaeribacter terreus TaxID=529703 RepID=A0ABW0EEN7_9BACT